MAIKKLKPESPNPRIKLNSDATLASYGEINFLYEKIQLIDPDADLTTFVADTISESTSGSGVTIDEALIKDGSFTGKQATATATAAGLTTGALTGADQFVTVTSASANDVVCLPAEATTPIGTLIRGWVGANGFELRPIAAEAATTTINAVTTSVEATIPATSLFKVEKVAANTWILVAWDELAAPIVAIVPHAI